MKVVLRLTDIGDIKKAKIVAYSDSSFANLPERKSQGGYIFFLLGKNGNAVPLGTARLVLDASAIQRFYLKQVLAEIIDLSAEKLPTIIYTDNHSFFESNCSTKTVDDK